MCCFSTIDQTLETKYYSNPIIKLSGWGFGSITKIILRFKKKKIH